MLKLSRPQNFRPFPTELCYRYYPLDNAILIYIFTGEQELVKILLAHGANPNTYYFNDLFQVNMTALVQAFDKSTFSYTLYKFYDIILKIKPRINLSIYWISKNWHLKTPWKWSMITLIMGKKLPYHWFNMEPM